MHRSGTSLTMGVLRRLGLELGPEDSLVPTIVEDNPDGYLEQQPFVDLDGELLAALGGHTSDPGPAPPGWHAEDRFAPHRARAAELVARTFYGDRWGWKDPRASLLLPFWRAVIPGLRIVICVRNPAEVAASMMRRHDHPRWEHWLRMWLRYTSDALSDSAGAERMVLLYDDLLAAPEREARRLGQFLLGEDADVSRVRAAATVVRDGTRRHRVSDAALVSDPRIPPEVAAAYLVVRAAVHSSEPLEPLSEVISGLSGALSARDQAAASQERWVHDRDELTAELERIRAREAVVLSSRSWRVTAPLRTIVRRGRGAR